MKSLLDAELVRLVGMSFSAVYPPFDRRRYQRRACRGLDELELQARAAHIADCLAAELPATAAAKLQLLIEALGPENPLTEGYGLQPFFYLPHSQLIIRHGSSDFAAGMRANYELTKRFTAEFSLRPFLQSSLAPCLRILAGWTTDPNPHVRRLVSEGSRPRLPWASRLPDLAAKPQLCLPLLQALKDDPVRYVRRSVANHLGDICKDHPQLVFDLLQNWAEEAETLPEAQRRHRQQLIRHAVRLPAKKGVAAALALRRAAGRR